MNQQPMMVKEQIALWPGDASAEEADFLERQLITYIGNKRALLGPIGQAVEHVKRRIGHRRLRSFDAFSGSGVVSRFLKAHSAYLASNDIEDYAAVTGRCFLSNHSAVDWKALHSWTAELNAKVCTGGFERGFIEDLYAPRNDDAITPEERVFYTRRNAQRLDDYRRLIELAPTKIRELLLGPLISRASIHANTAGVFKGFYKNKHTGIGQFGGSGSDALVRITGEITLEVPILSRFECDYDVFQEDANAAARRQRDLDLTYVDPPYNQHPYGSNYFMLNLLVRYQRPSEVSQVSGIPTNWRRSGYNVRARSLPLLRDLLESVDSRFLLVSFNNEGFISPPEMREMLERLGTVSVFETAYNAFRGSRNFNNRSIHVTEQLFLVERR
ncbi:MAG: hypothetical protein MNPFHGCM_02595 [Gemmatimonadaceae bacterium]|nr:hypothetical protein [Gemmatimonadaceae bacterium]